MGKVKSKNVKGGSPGLNITRLQFPKLRIQKLGEEKNRLPLRSTGLEVNAVGGRIMGH